MPSSVSNSYSFSTGTQGSSSRFLLISSFRSACSASSFASSSRAACHSSRVPIVCSGISSPSCFELGRSRRDRIHGQSDATGSQDETRGAAETISPGSNATKNGSRSIPPRRRVPAPSPRPPRATRIPANERAARREGPELWLVHLDRRPARCSVGDDMSTDHDMPSAAMYSRLPADRIEQLGGLGEEGPHPSTPCHTLPSGTSGRSWGADVEIDQAEIESSRFRFNLARVLSRRHRGQGIIVGDRVGGVGGPRRLRGKRYYGATASFEVPNRTRTRSGFDDDLVDASIRAGAARRRWIRRGAGVRTAAARGYML